MISWVTLPLSHIKNQFEDPEDEAADKIYEDGTPLAYTGTNESYFSSASPYYRTLYTDDDGLVARLYTTIVF